MEVEEIHRRIKKDEDVICSILKELEKDTKLSISDIALTSSLLISGEKELQRVEIELTTSKR